MFRYESKSEPLLSRGQFFARLAGNVAIVACVIAFSLTLGSVGYHFTGDLPWIDSLLNAAMILTGMGPVDRMDSTAGKLFATFYAIYSGVVFLTTVAVLIAPVLHRFMHSFHIADEEDEKQDEQRDEKQSRKLKSRHLE